MLTADYLDTLPQSYLDLVRRFEDSIIQDMARRMAKMGISSATAWQFQRLNEAGALEGFIYEELAKFTGQSEAVLRQKFEAAGIKAMKFEDAIYKAAGKAPTPLNLSPAMQQVMMAGYSKTAGLMRNLTMTTAIDTKGAFIDAIDKAYLQVVSGTMDYQSALKSAVKQLANDGLKVIHYASGRRDHIDVAARRSLLTGINQTAAQLQLTRADEMQSDLVQVTAHAGSRPSHVSFQGGVFSRVGISQKYPDFVSSTGYGTATGLCGINCRHSFHSFFEGLSPDVYKDAGIDPRQDKTVTYNGQEISFYDATQKQRAIERKIRYFKRQASALDAADIDNSVELQKVRYYQAQMRAFIKQTQITRQRFREQVFA